MKMGTLWMSNVGIFLCWCFASGSAQDWSKGHSNHDRSSAWNRDRPPPPPDLGDKLPVVFMEDHCRLHIRGYVLDDARVYVDESIHVELTKDVSSERQFACLVTFSTRDPDWRLLLHFEQVDINYNPGTVDRFRIYDGADAQKELTPQIGLYGKYSKGKYEFSSGSIRDYVSTGEALTLYFIGAPSASFGGFRILLTAFKNLPPSGQCEAGYFKCRVNKYCISESLLCNGAQNCGQKDLSDTTECHSYDPHGDANGLFHGPPDVGLLAGCALSIIILMVVVIWLGVICLKKKGLDRRLRRYTRHEADTSPPPDPCIVEPAEIQRVMSPPVSFMEPPPLYSENDVGHLSNTLGTGYSSGRFEMPPPYSPLDERDTAGLILNESNDSCQRNDNPDLLSERVPAVGPSDARARATRPVHNSCVSLPPVRVQPHSDTSESSSTRESERLNDGTSLPVMGLSCQEHDEGAVPWATSETEQSEVEEAKAADISASHRGLSTSVENPQTRQKESETPQTVQCDLMSHSVA